jgi:hypothetical protein
MHAPEDDVAGSYTRIVQHILKQQQLVFVVVIVVSYFCWQE